MSRSKISDELLEIEDEVEKLEGEISKLRKRRTHLLARKEQILARICAEDVDESTLLNKWDNDQFPWAQKAQRTLEKNFKLQTFRPLQKAVINAVMSKEDVIVIMNTGGGKSLCYQLPALLMEGLSLVISPLVSLVEDQLAQLKNLGIEAATLNQNSTKEEVARIEKAITQKESSFRLLYVTPEKLAKSKRIMNKLEKSLDVGFFRLIAIDEVHCCSQWGHDFRKDYSFLNVLKRQFKGVPILGLTATATQKVLDDVKEMLGLQSSIVFRAGFNRPNLHYEVIHRPSTDNADEIVSLIKNRFHKQSGIIYCFSRKDCEELAKKLKALGLSAYHYHAYLEPAKRTKVHENWCSGKIQVIVATVAFGMGIDKPDVRFVIHQSIPKSIENFYQESGRAGRDGEKSVCILFYRLADLFRISTMVCVDKTGGENLYNMIRYATEKKECRRAILARHFETDYDPAWCDNACDNCQAHREVQTVDVTSIMSKAAEIIEEQKSNKGSGRITGGKLLELLLKSVKASKEHMELVISGLLLNKFLEESFHFTPYSIISYIEVGPKWHPNAVVTLDLVPESTKAKKRKIEEITL